MLLSALHLFVELPLRIHIRKNLLIASNNSTNAMKPRINGMSVHSMILHQISILIRRRQTFLLLKLDIQSQPTDFIAQHIE